MGVGLSPKDLNQLLPVQLVLKPACYLVLKN